jgi:hypothetical protein
MPAEVIERVHALAQQGDDQSNTLSFGDRLGNLEHDEDLENASNADEDLEDMISIDNDSEQGEIPGVHEIPGVDENFMEAEEAEAPHEELDPEHNEAQHNDPPYEAPKNQGHVHDIHPEIPGVDDDNNLDAGHVNLPNPHEPYNDDNTEQNINVNDNADADINARMDQ